MSRLLPRLRAAGEHAVALLLVGVAMLPWLAVTGPGNGHLGVLGAVATGALLSLVLVRVLSLSGGREVAISTLALVAFLLIAVIGDPLAVAELGRGLRDGLPRILSTSLPILDAPGIGVPGSVVGWAAGATVTSLVARTRQVAAPLAIAFGAFVGGYAVTLAGSGGDPNALATREVLALVALAGLLVLLRTPLRVPAGQRGRASARVGLAGLVLATSLGLAGAAAVSAPYLRDEPVTPSISPPAQAREPISPLLVARMLRSEQPEDVIGEVVVDHEWSGYVPLALLDRYDGRIWELTQSSFVPTGGTLPVELPLGGGTARFEEIDLDATGGWLPFVARPASVEDVAVLHNGGAALQLAEPSADASYQLALAQGTWGLDDPRLAADTEIARAAVPPLETPDPSGDRRPAGERLCRVLATARTPDAEPAIADEPCGERGPTTVAFLRELASVVESGRSVPEDLVGGEQLEAGSEALSDLLGLASQTGTQAAVGTPEQFASTYALVAAEYGLPVRVVTGLRVGEDELEDPGEPVQLRGAQAWTWVEVPVEDVGWVVVDASPQTQEEVEEEEQEAAEEVTEEQETTESERTALGVDPSQVVGRAPPSEPQSPLVLALWAIGGIVGLVLLTVAVAGTRRWWRRRRRRTGPASERAVGAWHELLDALYDVGVPDVETLTAEDVLSALIERLDVRRDRITPLAEAANRAVFSSRPMDDEEADRCWELVGELRRSLRRRRPWRRRLAALVLPAPADLHTTPPTVAADISA